MDEIPAPDALPIAMDEAEKMLALKKAYADMILNTAKEAAARVMAAERKAKKYEKELEFTKAEAIQMLIRMKQEMEAMNAESGNKLTNQQKKIEELELQLEEAEGLILDLRAKLTKFQEQSDSSRFREQALNSLREKESVNQPFNRSSLSSFKSNPAACKLQAPCLDHHSMVHQSPGPLAEPLISSSGFDSCLVDAPVYDSIYFRKGGPELCNDECIRRIQAVEKDLVDGIMPLADVSVPLDESNSSVLKKEQLGVNVSVPSKAHKLDLVEKVTTETPFLIDSATKGWSQKIQMLRRRRTRQAKSKAKAQARGCRYFSGRCVKSQRTFSAITRCTTYLASSTTVDTSNLSKMHARKQAQNESELKRTDAVNSSHYRGGLSCAKREPISVARRSTRKRKVKHWEGFSTLCRKNGAKRHRIEESYKKSKEPHCTVKLSEHLLEGNYEVEVEDYKCSAPLANSHKCTEGSADPRNAKVSENDSELIDVPMLVTPATSELDSASLVSSAKKGTKMLRLTDKAESEHRSSKFMTNTFRCSRSARKRKNTWMNIDSGKQAELDLIPQASVVNESMDDSGGLVQIAHQLISLSATGW